MCFARSNSLPRRVHGLGQEHGRFPPGKTTRLAIRGSGRKNRRRGRDNDTENFERHGEPAFRQLEAEQLRSALGRATERMEPTIVALGGGTYAQAGAPEFLRNSGIPVIWLDTPIEVLLSRCMTMTGRPLFRDEASFRALYAQRLPSYQLADYRVESSGDPAAVVGEILRRGIGGVTEQLPDEHKAVEGPVES